MTSVEAKTEVPEAPQRRVEALGIDPRDVVSFPEGLPGFEACRGFVVLENQSTAPLQSLLAVDGPEATFLALDPKLALPTYRYKLSEADRLRLHAAGDEPLLWLALVMIEADGAIAVNLRAPIVINPARMVGFQLMPHDTLYPLRHLLAPGE